MNELPFLMAIKDRESKKNFCFLKENRLHSNASEERLNIYQQSIEKRL